MSNLQEDGFPGLQEQFDPPTVNVHVLLDISTSMISRWQQTISGLNEYVEGLRQSPDPCKISITTFGLEREVKDLYTNVGLDQVKKFDEKTFYPNGCGTALWGSIGVTLKKINTTEPVLFIVITDGEENSSHTYTSKSIDELIQERTKLGNYTFAYLGVAKEAWGQEAQVSAFAQSKNLTAGEDYNCGTYTNLAKMSNQYRGTMQSNAFLRKVGAPVSMGVKNLFDQEPTVNEEDTEVKPTL